MGTRPDGTTLNDGNHLGDRPSIKLFSEYNQGHAMRAALGGDDDADAYQPRRSQGRGIVDDDRPPAGRRNDYRAPAQRRAAQRVPEVEDGDDDFGPRQESSNPFANAAFAVWSTIVACVAGTERELARVNRRQPMI